MKNEQNRVLSKGGKNHALRRGESKGSKGINGGNRRRVEKSVRTEEGAQGRGGILLNVKGRRNAFPWGKRGGLRDDE